MKPKLSVFASKPNTLTEKNIGETKNSKTKKEKGKHRVYLTEGEGVTFLGKRSKRYSRKSEFLISKMAMTHTLQN